MIVFSWWPSAEPEVYDGHHGEEGGGGDVHAGRLHHVGDHVVLQQTTQWRRWPAEEEGQVSAFQDEEESEGFEGLQRARVFCVELLYKVKMISIGGLNVGDGVEVVEQPKEEHFKR